MHNLYIAYTAPTSRSNYVIGARIGNELQNNQARFMLYIGLYVHYVIHSYVFCSFNVVHVWKFPILHVCSGSVTRPLS